MSKGEIMSKVEILDEAQKQIDSFKQQLDALKLKEKVDGLSADALKTYETQKRELESLISETESKFKELSDKASDSWQESKDFVELTQKALKHSFNYFMSHYK